MGGDPKNSHFRVEGGRVMGLLFTVRLGGSNFLGAGKPNTSGGASRMGQFFAIIKGNSSRKSRRFTKEGAAMQFLGKQTPPP